MTAPTTFKELIGLFLDLINPILGLMVGFALLAFFKGLVSFIAKAGDARSHEAGRSLMVWGIIGLFVMVSVFGILRFFYSDFGFSRPFGLPLLPTYEPRPLKMAVDSMVAPLDC